MMTKNEIPDPSALEQQKSGRSLVGLSIFGILCLFFLVLFTSLGIWQVERLGWKQDLIAKADQRVHAAAVEAPLRNDWSKVSYDQDEYRKVYISGHYLNDKEVLVTAVADNNSGYWVMTPLQREDGTITFINRGFITMSQRDQTSRLSGLIEGETTVTGLLRTSEGTGFYPRKNNPEADIWYSRNIAQMATKTSLENVAPYFIDADGSTNRQDRPIGGLTVVTFPNNHLSYAITWFTLAIGVLAATIFLIRDERKRRRKTN